MNVTRTRILSAGAVVAATAAGFALGQTQVPAPTASASTAALPSPAPQNVNIVVMPGIKLGPDKRLHDAFTPSDFSGRVGQKITLTVYNYDTSPHSMVTTSPSGLTLNVIFKGAPKVGLVGKTTFTFTPTKAGTYHWLCAEPCDDYSMSHNSYVRGLITITK